MFITSPAHFIPPAPNYSTLPSFTQTSATHPFVGKIVSAMRRGVFLVGGKGILRVGRNKTISLLRQYTHKKMEVSVQLSGKSSDALCASAFEGCVITHISLWSAVTWPAWSVSSHQLLEELAFVFSASCFHHPPDHHYTTNSYCLWFMPVLSLSYPLPKFLPSLSEALLHCPSVYPLHPWDAEVSITTSQLLLSACWHHLCPVFLAADWIPEAKPKMSLWCSGGAVSQQWQPRTLSTCTLHNSGLFCTGQVFSPTLAKCAQNKDSGSNKPKTLPGHMGFQVWALKRQPTFALVLCSRAERNFNAFTQWISY